jgi:diguanylate cyclase (GGDEF)-like protein
VRKLRTLPRLEAERGPRDRSATGPTKLSAKSTDDDVADLQLQLRIGLVVVGAFAAVGANFWLATRLHDPAPNLAALALVCAGVVIANRLKVYVRVRSSRDGTAWGEVPVLIGLMIAPMPWVVVCVGIGMIIVKVSARAGLKKSAFAVAKEVLSATAAGAVLIIFGVHPDLTHPVFAPVAIIVAFCVMSIVDLLAFLPVFAAASRSTIAGVALKDWDGRLIGMSVRLAVILLVVAALSGRIDILLLTPLPPIAASMHLWHSRRLRTREERESWQRLSQAIDALNVVDLTEVLHLATTRLAQIFSADEAEIALSVGTATRLVRGGTAGVVHDGTGPVSLAGTDSVIDTELQTNDGAYHAGMLRLRFRGRVSLTEFERYKFETFAAALCTAIRNARAYTELARISAENAHAATHDALTGLANRRALLDEAGRAFDTRGDDGILALLLIDLNHFKEINDTLGHAAGDRVLCEVACRLQRAASPSDLVARLGGDEFAVLFSKLPTPAMAAHRAETILATLDHTIEVDGMHLTVEGAGGIALAPGTGGVQELMRRADVAMYQAKRSGNRTASYVHSRDTADLGRLTMGSELKRAVERHEFVVDFQPIVDLGTGEVVSAEALTRWHHPEQGNLTPLAFLETVERSGQLPAFSDAVLEQSLAAAGHWREAGFDVPVAVNVSPRSLLDPEFPAAVLARLERHHLPPDRLVLELAETLTISQLEVVARALGELRDAGVRLALDNFGTGVSSLSVLSRIPVHQLKIDRNFVVSLETSSEASAVIRSTVDLARSLHLTVVADGVESEPQRHALWELGCVAGQGHLFARPMQAERMLATLRRGTGGRPGALAETLYESGSVVRMPRRRSPGHGRSSLPHLPA